MNVRVKTGIRADAIGTASVKVVSAVSVLLILLSPLSGGGARSSALKGPLSVLPAAIRASQTSSLPAEISGRVASVMVSPGSVVQPGQVIAILESPEVMLTLERSRSRFKLSQDKLARLEGAGTGDLRLRIHREQYRAASRAWETSQERMARFTLVDAEKSYAQAKARADRLRELLGRRLATSAEYEQSQQMEQMELRTLRTAREQSSRLQQEAEAADSQLKMAKMNLELVEGTELAAARMEFEQASADLRVANQKAVDLRVIARRPGTILAAQVSPGDYIFAGTPMFQIADLSMLNIEAPVTAKVARQIPLGSPVRVRIPTDPARELTAAVSALVLVPDAQTQSYLVRVTIPNPDPKAILAGLEAAIVVSHVLPAEDSWTKRLF